MNSVIKQLLEHKSIRNFDENSIVPSEDLDLIIQAAQQASSWNNAQHYSIIHVKSSDLKEKMLKKLVDQNQNQAHILKAPVFLVFVADLYRAKLASDKHGKSFSVAEEVDTLITAVTDASIAAQNAVIAAESLGYGTCYIGYLRWNIKGAVSALKLPKYTYPVFGLCIGKPSKNADIKPRLPKEAVFFEDNYQTKYLTELIDEYEQTMSVFAEKRETLPWSEKIATLYDIKDPQLHDIDLLINQGFLKK